LSRPADQLLRRFRETTSPLQSLRNMQQLLQCVKNQ